MQKQIYSSFSRITECRLCGEQIPRMHIKQHLRHCEKSLKRRDSSVSSDESQRRRRFFGPDYKSQARQRQIFDSHRQSQRKSATKQCKYCHQRYSINFVYQHQSFCYQNQEANQIRKKYPSSSDEDNQHWNRSSSNQSDNERPRQSVARERETFFHHRPRREYRLSQTSSEEDESEKHWRNYHQNRITALHDLTIRILQTTIEGVTIVVTSDGENGPVLKRVVHNQRTGQRKQISEHRYLRHYAMHTINPYLARTNNRNRRQSNNASNVSPSLSSELQQALERLTVSMNQLQNNLNLQRGLTKSELSLFQKRNYKKRSSQNEKCSICHEDYEQEQFVTSLKCFHFFHSNCIVEWLEKKPNCPLCKTKQN